MFSDEQIQWMSGQTSGTPERKWWHDWQPGQPLPAGASYQSLIQDMQGISPIHAATQLLSMQQAGMLQSLPDFDPAHFQSIAPQLHQTKGEYESSGRRFSNLGVGSVAAAPFVAAGAQGLFGGGGAVPGAAGDMFGSGAVFGEGAAGLGGGMAGVGGTAAATAPAVASAGPMGGAAASTLAPAAGGLLGGSMMPLLAGGLLGGLAAGQGSSQSGTTTTTQTPWAPQQPFIMEGLQGASQQFGQQGTSTPLLNPAQSQMGKTIAGDYLNPETNPYLKSTFDAAARGVTDHYKNTVQPRNDAMFFGPGSMGGNSAYQQTTARNQYGLGENLQNLATNIYGGNYQTERGRQNQASTLAPSFTSDYYGASQSPFSSYLNNVGRPFGGSTQQPYFENRGAGLLGGALGGAALGKMLFT